MLSHSVSLLVAQRLTDAIASRDRDRFAEIYRDDTVVWHNFSNRTQTASENIDLLTRIFAVTRELGYRDITRLLTPEGFVQHHSLAGIFADGTPMAPIHSCIVATVRDGRILRLNEWLDSRQFGELWQRIKQL
ncbi:nuclear transport factor 2 family protein [Sphingomonas sp. YL-JM2C]